MEIVLTYTFCVIWLTLNLRIIHGELDWVVNERVSGYGDNVTLFCVVDDCCKKAAGWIKFDPDYTTIFLDMRDFKYKTSKKDKYAATTNSTGFSLVIRNVREDDFNIKYLCSYGFEKSSQKVLSQSDAFKVEPELPLVVFVVIIIVSITAVIISVLLVIWRRKANCRQNTNWHESSALKTENNKVTNELGDSLLTKKADESSNEYHSTPPGQFQQHDEPVGNVDVHRVEDSKSKD